MSYAADHADAHADVAAAGTPVSFVSPARGTYDPTTDQTTGASQSTIPGVAMRVKGNPAAYEALGLIASDAETLLFVPDVYGQRPVLGATVVWAGAPAVVKSIEATDLDGAGPILARVVISR